MKKTDRMLIVDDNSSILEVLKIGLDGNNFDIDAFDNGEDALRVFKKNKYKFALLDIRLPGISGLELTKQINNIDDNVIIILMTGYPDINNVVEALRNKVYDYIIKPFKLAQIMAIIERAENTLELINENKNYLKIIKNLENENENLRNRIKKLAPMVYKFPRTINTKDSVSQKEVINSYTKHQDDSLLSYDNDEN